MKAPNEISVISINNKEDVLKTIELFNKIGINVFKDKLSKNWFILSEEEITKCFLISDNDGNWRLQSHFLTDGISVKQLEEIINTVLSINEQIKNDIGSVNNLKNELKKFKKSIKEFENKLNSL